MLTVLLLIVSATLSVYAWSLKVQLESFESPAPMAKEEKVEVSLGPSTQDETANWKTYRNQSLGFLIKYPETLYLYDDKDDAGPNSVIISNLKFPISLDDQDKAWRIHIDVSGNEDRLTSKQIVDREMVSWPAGTLARRESISVDGHPAERINGSPMNQAEILSLDVYLSKENKLYILALWPHDQEVFPDFYPESEKVFDQILSTFKFLNN